MAQAPLAVTALGMISSLGHSVVTSCAAARAGLTRASQLDTFSINSDSSADWGPVPVVGHSVAAFAEGFEGIGKLVRLGSAALADLIEYAGLRKEDLGHAGIYLNLPSGYHQAAALASRGAAGADDAGAESPEGVDEVKEFCRTALARRLGELNGIQLPAETPVLFGDHAGIAAAIWDVARRLETGERDFYILGGIDSCVETPFLRAVSELGLLKDEEHPAALMPGEAAAFVLLEPLHRARARGARIEAVLEGANVTAESCHRASGEPSVGVALAAAIGTTLEELAEKGRDVGLIVGDLNGDAWRAAEWGYAIVRLTQQYPWLRDQPQWYPATSFGEVGAASGVVAICMAARAFARNYARTDRVLVWLSSDDGRKGSFSVRRS
jgi:3-oxoacyl-[acyl-carrier-protein] synthase-1